MTKELIISKDDFETRIALIEDGKLAEIFIERDESTPKHGNIYKGKVMQVLPGIQASFIDIGWEKSAFLYAGDFFEIEGSDYDFFESGTDESENGENCQAENPNESGTDRKGFEAFRRLRRRKRACVERHFYYKPRRRPCGLGG